MMSKQATFNTKMEYLKDLAEERVKERAKEIVHYAVDVSPVDTGAYVESFSVVPRGAGGGRMRSSKGKPRNQNKQAVQEQEKARLSQDVEALNITESGGFVLRNRSPHAHSVEFGSKVNDNWKKDGYYVFTKTVGRFK